MITGSDREVGASGEWFMPPWNRVVRRGLSAVGVLFGALFFCLSLTPSLLPRGWLLQGVVGGVAAACGYGVGAGPWAVMRRFGWRTAARPVRGAARWALCGAGAVLIVVFLLAAQSWQRDQRRLLGMPAPADWNPAGVLLTACAVFAVLLLAARCVRLGTRWLIGSLGRSVPAPVAVAVGLATGVVVVIGFVQGFLFNALVEGMNRASSVTNDKTPPGVLRPSSPLVSGSPASRAGWTTLGFEGRYFAATATPQARIAAFTGRPARPPIRVYAGLDSAGSFGGRARLAVAELERTGAFTRSVLAIMTTTGTGWVDEKAAAGLEYLHGGDTAIVSTQYSYLPSWLSFLVDRAKAAESARTLIGAVRARLDALPAERRPRLLLYGESLGSFGIEEAAGDRPGLESLADGTLLVGPPFVNPVHQAVTDRRDPASPVWLPVYQGGRAVRFARVPADLAPRGGAPEPSVVYLQNATDPIVWWSPGLLLSSPPWLDAPRAPDLAPGMRWYPIVTFWQTAVDLIAANGVPPGHGHRYGANVVDGLVALDRPAGWTDRDTHRLRDLIAQPEPVRK